MTSAFFTSNPSARIATWDTDHLYDGDYVMASTPSHMAYAWSTTFFRISRTHSRIFKNFWKLIFKKVLQSEVKVAIR